MKRKMIIAVLASLLISMVSLIPAEAGWKKDSKGWWYQYDNGSYPVNEMVHIGKDDYYFDKDGYMVTGWMTYGGYPVYFKKDGRRARCEWIDNRWLNFYGFVETNNWVDNGRYYVGSDGYWQKEKGTRSTRWVKDAKGWKYDAGNGSFFYNGLFEIDRELYYFVDGYMQTGWQRFTAGIYDYWRYFDNGRMLHDEWYADYWFDQEGIMILSDWVDDGKYFVGSNGRWVPGKKHGGWENDGKGWKYDETGYGDYLISNYYEIDGKIYGFDLDGYMLTGWVEESGSWLFFQSDGSLKKNAWEGNYWLRADGSMAVSEWVDGGKYYVGADGKWVPGKKHGGWEHDGKGWKYDTSGNGDYVKSNFRLIDGQTYAFNGQGYMTTGWVYFAGSWFFFKTDGTMKKNAWEGDYWLGSDGIMATSAWVDGGKYYVGPDGKWVPKP